MNDTTATLTIDVSLPLDRFTLRITHAMRARTLGVFGPSGAGKTSLIEVIAGLRPRARGTLRLGDLTWPDTKGEGTALGLPPEQRDVGYVAQDDLLFPHRNVRGNLLAGARRARRRGLDPDQQLQHVTTLLELEPLLDCTVDTLSGGERRRVALGRALCSGPRLLLLDEPLTALDDALRRKIRPYLLRIRQQLAVPMVLVSHDAAEITALCDEVIVLGDGRIVAAGPPRELWGTTDVRAQSDVLAGTIVPGAHPG